MTKQELFDKVVRAIIAQGGASVEQKEGGRVVCMYRAKNGRKCAAGHVLSDDQYWAGFEGLPVSALVEFDDIPERSLLRDLQNAHDRASCNRQHDGSFTIASDEEFMPRFLADARHLAEEYKLDASACEVQP